MKKSWFIDALIGFFLTLFVAGCYWLPGLFPFFESLELKSYDARSQLRQAVDTHADIVIIAIDDASVSQWGRWPWSRALIAQLIDKIESAKPKVVGLDIVYSEPAEGLGLNKIKELQSQYWGFLIHHKILDRNRVFSTVLSSAAVSLDTDSKLLASFQNAGNIVLPFFLSEGGLLGAKAEPLPAYFSSATITGPSGASNVNDGTSQGAKITAPLAFFAQASLGLGHVNVYPDFDGVVRMEKLALKYSGAYLPSYGLELALAYWGIKPSDIRYEPGSFLKNSRVTIPVDSQGKMAVTFNGPAQTFPYYSARDVLADKVAPEALKDKLVIVGPTATGVATLYTTPVSHNFPSVEMVANVTENILHQRFLVRPPWAEKAEWGLLAFVGFFLMLVLPHLRAFWGAIVSFLLFAAMMAGGSYFFVNSQWLKVTYPAILLVLGYLIIISRRFFSTEKRKELVEASAIETNKMLGLAFQSQGLLDLALEKLSLCPLESSIKDALYNLALDFERKRQWMKAVSALERIASKDPKYKDVAKRIPVLKQAGEGAVFGPVGGGAKKGGTVVLTGGASKPTLGRYEIEKELGRGAMGIVYLGKDPKINREVAIKTLAFEEAMAADEVKDMKERFFREAQAAGTLNHPNIIKIFDAGEDQEVAYIAMEFLEGQDLSIFTAKDRLLPVDQAMEYVATAAEALDYAHSHGIVHRDVKPANIMRLKDGTIRVADFGIARITASSKTATGTVLGTPSYMSPEQVAGKKVDGRSDLFSLGTVLFELLTGEKPFKGGEGIGTLLFQIANDPYPDPLAINPKLPVCAVEILKKSSAKDVNARYQRGSEMAADLRACVAASKKGTPAVAQSEKTLRITPDAAA